MDKKASGKVSHEDVTREALIAISEFVPDKDNNSSQNLKKEGVVNGKKSDNLEKYRSNTQNLKKEGLVNGKKSDKAEKYRSKLISISHTKSTDC